MTRLSLKSSSPANWIETVLTRFDDFLLDHAANERKASAMAMSMVAHYPDRTRLVTAMIELALEELNHFRQVVKLATSRQLTLRPDEKDPYVNQIQVHMRKGKDDYFLDRLLSAAVIEARGAERFDIIATTITDPELATFYKTLARSEHNHHQLFINLAGEYFSRDAIDLRLEEWLQIENTIMTGLPIRPRLH
ncbi:MAG: tRNA-(ms[2]io[6]A)-hydroxylase [Pseudomonadales bacterium]